MKPRRLIGWTVALVLSLARVGTAQSPTITAQLTAATCPAPAGCVALSIFGMGAASVQITGTFVGTLQLETSLDGVTYTALAMTPVAGGATVTSATAAGAWSSFVGGLGQLRVRMSAYTSGLATVTIAGAPGLAAPGLAGVVVGNGVNSATAVAIPADATKFFNGIGAFAVPSGVALPVVDTHGDAIIIEDANGNPKLQGYDTSHVAQGTFSFTSAGIAQINGTTPGTVTSVSVATANGVSGSVATATTTPAITLSLGAITPSTVTVGAGSAITSSGAGGALGSNAFSSVSFLPLAGGTLVGNLLFTDNTYDIGASAATRPRHLYMAGKILNYNAIATAGFGVPAIVAAGRVTAQSAANASISTYTVGASDGSFEVSANMNVTAAMALVTTLTCTYTDESNTARTMILPVAQVSGSFIAAGAITGTGAWETPVIHIRAKAATAITILTSTGTFTGVTYTAEGIIKQVS